MSNNKSIKNEHLVWAYAELEDGRGQIVLCGITELGLTYLRENPGKTLIITAPDGGFKNVVQILTYSEKNKKALKDTLRKAGVAIREVDRVN